MATKHWCFSCSLEGQGRVLADVENLSLAHKKQISAFDQLLSAEIPDPRQEEQKDQHSSMASHRWHIKCHQTDK